MTEYQQNLSKARQTFDTLRTSQRRAELFSAISKFLSVIIALALVITLIETIFPSPSIYRKLELLIISVLTGFSAVLIGHRFLSDKRLKTGSESEEWWAITLGKIAPEVLRDRLLNALQIVQQAPSTKDNFSADLARHALYLAVADLDDITITRALDFKNRNLGMRTAGIVTAAAILTFAIIPGGMSDAIGRIMHPNREYVVELPYELSVSHDQDWAYRGEPVEFQIAATGTPPKSVEFEYHYDGGENQVETVFLRGGSAVLEFKGFSDPITYHVESKNVVSQPQRLKIVTRPQITELQYRLFPPAYSRLPVEIGRENIGNVEALPGSRLELTVRSSKPLETSWLIFQKSNSDSTENDSTKLEISHLSATVQLDLFRNGTYHIRLRDDQGHFDKDPVFYRVMLLTDEYPTVRITFPEADIELGESTMLPLTLEADDDFGIGRMAISYHQMGEDTTVYSEKVKLDQSGIPTVEVDHFWEIGELYLMPGDVIEYWAIAWDTDNVNGPKRAESERRLVRLPSMEEIFAGVEETEEIGMDQAERTMEAAKELRENVEEILQEMRKNPEVNWERQQQMEDALEQQDNLQKQVEELAKTINELAEKLDKHDLAKLETLEKYKELQELISQIATPEMREAMEKLRQAMEEQDPDQIREALEDLAMDQEEFLKNIERSMEILKQLQLERKLDELVKQIEEILHEQEDILGEMDGDEQQNTADRQKDLAKPMETFHNRLQETGNLAEENEAGDLAAQLDSLMQELASKDIPANMREAGAELSEGNKKEAKSGAEMNARDLAELLSKLNQMANDFKEAKKDELADKIRRTTEDMLYLSEDQEELSDQSKELGTQSPRYRTLAGRQDDIRSALGRIIEGLFEISKETFFITPDLGAALGKAAKDLDKAIERYTDRNPRSVSQSQTSALGSMNSAIRQLIDILGQIQDSNSSTGYEEMLERLSEMASSQSSLNQQSMPMPGQEGQQSMPGGQGSGSMQRLAAQQRELQRQMEELGDDAQGMQEILGDLDALAKNMGEVANDMEDQNVTQRTRRLQQQIVSRLLDATRSAREKEYSQKRESKSGEDITRRSPEQLQLDSDTQKLRRDLKRALQEGYTRDYRRLIRAYFRSLEEIEKQETVQPPAR